jgi:hypothetical protein
LILIAIAAPGGKASGALILRTYPGQVLFTRMHAPAGPVPIAVCRPRSRHPANVIKRLVLPSRHQSFDHGLIAASDGAYRWLASGYAECYQVRHVRRRGRIGPGPVLGGRVRVRRGRGIHCREGLPRSGRLGWPEHLVRPGPRRQDGQEPDAPSTCARRARWPRRSRGWRTWAPGSAMVTWCPWRSRTRAPRFSSATGTM